MINFIEVLSKEIGLESEAVVGLFTFGISVMYEPLMLSDAWISSYVTQLERSRVGAPNRSGRCGCSSPSQRKLSTGWRRRRTLETWHRMSWRFVGRRIFVPWALLRYKELLSGSVPASLIWSREMPIRNFSTCKLAIEAVKIIFPSCALMMLSW